MTGLLKCAKCGYSVKVLKDKSHRYLLCSGRYNLSHCDATIRINLDELELAVAQQIDTLLKECPAEKAIPRQNDLYAKELAELDRRADRLMDAFAESSDLSPTYLHRALARLEEDRQALLEAKRREDGRLILPQKLIFLV